MARAVPDLVAAETFYTPVWQLAIATRGDGVARLRGGGNDHHLLALHAAPGTPTIRQLPLRVRSGALKQAQRRERFAAAR